MSIGDINSSARGSGARFNDGKPAMELLDFDFVRGVYEEHESAPFLESMAMYQQTGYPEWILDAFHRLPEWVNLSEEELLRSAARVFDYGRKKYAEWNWAKGMPWSVPLACIARHALSIAEGEYVDPESGEPHYGHIVCNLVMLYTFIRTYPEGNDLPIRELGRFEIAANERRERALHELITGINPEIMSSIEASNDGYWYVATPYTSHPLGQHEAYKAANEAAARLHTDLGMAVFSPISHSHSLCSIYGTKNGIRDHLDARFWQHFDKPLLDAAYGLAVVMMPGWDSSKGIHHEIMEAKQQDKPIHYFSWPELKHTTSWAAT